MVKNNSIPAQRDINGLFTAVGYYCLLTAFCCLIHAGVYAQVHYECLTCKNDTPVKDIKPYIGFIHQHHDFFNKAFSYQAIEAGITINQAVHVGIYAATFASNLSARIVDKPYYVNIQQTGLSFGKTFNPRACLHTGCSINAGYFALHADTADFAILNSRKTAINISGLILAPQAFAEVNITNRISFRTGLAYNIYSFEDHSIITTNHLNNISINFGFMYRFQPKIRS